MSAQVVIPSTKLPHHQVATSSATTTSSKSTSGSDRSPNVTRRNRFPTGSNRWRPPRKPEIQVDKNELKQKLTPLQYKVTQEKFTERAFSGEYVRLNDKGIYCCIVCGEELFSSETKYDSGCGWPAFFNTIDQDKLILQTDLSHIGGNLLLLALNQDLARTEVTCAKCGSHLGHVFDDGPRPTGKRYCVNSASLKFKKANGEEVICDIPSGGCCFRSPTKTSSSPVPSSNDVIINNQPGDNNKDLKINNNKDNSSKSEKPKGTLKESKPVTTETINHRQWKPMVSPKPRFDTQLSNNEYGGNGRQHFMKTKSLSPTIRSTLLTEQQVQSSTNTAVSTAALPTHARKVQNNREDFFKSTTSTLNPAGTASTATTNYTTRTKNSDIERRAFMNSLLSPSTTTTLTNNQKPISNPRINSNKKNSHIHGEDNHHDAVSSSSLNYGQIGKHHLHHHDVNNNKTTLTAPLNHKYSDVKSRYLDHLDSLSKKSVIKHTFSGTGPKKITNSNNINISGDGSAATNNSILESDL